ELRLQGPRTAHGVQRVAPGRDRQPGTRPLRHTVALPCTQRRDVRVLQRLLGEVEVARDAHRRGEHVGPLAPVRVGDGSLDGRQSSTSKPISGRTSTPPSTIGVSFARATAWSRSRASITNTPPMTSFVSMNGPSV